MSHRSLGLVLLNGNREYDEVQGTLDVITEYLMHFSKKNYMFCADVTLREC